MAQFERLMTPSEQEVAGRLKSYIADVQDNPQQVVKQASSVHVGKYCVWVCTHIGTYRKCLWVCFCFCLAVAGVSKAQGANQTSQCQQRASVRERDPAGQTARLQQRFTVLLQNTFISLFQ